MWRSFGLLVALLSLRNVVVAHRPLPPGVTCSNQFNASDTPLVVPNPRISWAAYRILTCDAPIFWLSAEDVDVGQNLSFTVTIPVIDRFADVRAHVLVIGPGLPELSGADEALVPAGAVAAIQSGEGAVLYMGPEDQSSCAHLFSDMMTMASDVTDGRCHFHEPYGDTHSWVVLDDMLTAVGNGTYRFAAFTGGTTAKLSFACCDWPEDFTTPFPMEVADCPFCGTEADFAFHSAHFYETKNMAEFGGFPALEDCSQATSPQVPNVSTQCPDEAAAPAPGESPESCFLGCAGEECHSHNVFGECTYEMRWVTPKPMISSKEVTSLILFKGEKVHFTSQGHMWPHNVVQMGSAAHLENCDFEGGTQILTVEEVLAGTSVTFSEAGVFYYACEITGHCLLGQKLVVEVKDASEGLRCHSHAVEQDDDGDLSCGVEEVHAHLIGSADYGAGADECSEFCASAAALGMMVGAENGTCRSAGYPAEVREVTVQPAGSPMAMFVVVYGREEHECHCHSYEQIHCDSAGDDLYAEHIEEIETYCQGIVDATDDACPYRCFQPFEVLHLHYLECSSRAKNSLYEQIEETGKCHLAAPAPSGADCGEGGEGGSSGQTSTEQAPPPTSSSQMTALTSGLQVSMPFVTTWPGILVIAAFQAL
mmetsp:Transcript_397/g.1363  ORF Transcript_397/g.1363 Transcript_397/m.1363 type:complete len:651 (-) Transcript_397:103-2055(-)